MTSHGASCGSVRNASASAMAARRRSGPPCPVRIPATAVAIVPTQRARCVRGWSRSIERRGAGSRRDVARELAGQHAVREEQDRGVGVLVGHLGARGDEHVPRPLDRPGAHGDRTVERGRADALPGGLRQPGGAVAAGRSRTSGEPARHALSAAETSRSTRSRRVGREARGAFEPGRGHGVRPPGPGPPRRLVDHRGDGGVRCRGRLAEVPGATVDVVVGQRLRERGVDRAPGRRGRLGVDAGADEVVPERHLVGADGQQLRLGRLVEVGHAHAEQLAGAVDHGQVAPGGRRDDHGGPRVGGQHVGSAREGARERGGHRDGGPRGQRVDTLVAELEQRERVAAGRREQTGTRVVGQPAPERPRELGRLGVAETLQRERGQPGRADDRRNLVAHGQQDDDRVGGQPTGGEAQRLRPTAGPAGGRRRRARRPARPRRPGSAG